MRKVLIFVDVLEEFKHPDSLPGNVTMELDLYFPKLNLAFEYQVFLKKSVLVYVFFKGRTTLFEFKSFLSSIVFRRKKNRGYFKISILKRKR